MTGDTGFSHYVNALRLPWPTPANDAVVALTTRERCVKWALASRAAENHPTTQCSSRWRCTARYVHGTCLIGRNGHARPLATLELVAINQGVLP